MTAIGSQPATTPKRRWYQYNLRTVMLFMVLASIPLSWVAVKIQEGRKERQVVRVIEKLGGRVWYPDTSAPRWLRGPLGAEFFERVGAVYLDRTQVTDAGLARIKGWTQLRELELSGTRVTDAALEYIKGLGHLVSLSLDDTQVTDTGLEYLKGLNQLQMLSLDDTQVTDTGLEHLKGLNRLVILFLDRTQVTDAGLGHLKGLNQLEVLSLRGTKVTDESVKKLQKALPKCEIVRR